MTWFFVLSAIIGALALLLVAPLVLVQRATRLFEPATDEEKLRLWEDGTRPELIPGSEFQRTEQAHA